MQKPAQRALRLLDVLARETRKEERLLDLLRDPESGATVGWAFHAPTCFNDALDIRQTQRKVDGKAIPTWTQGPNFAFGRGDVLYDTPQGYHQWSEALKVLGVCIQVKAAIPKSSGNSAAARDSGTVTFDVLRPTSEGKALTLVGTRSLSQEEFVRLLITGEGLARKGGQ